MESEVWLGVGKMLGTPQHHPKIIPHFNLFQTSSVCVEIEYLTF